MQTVVSSSPEITKTGYELSAYTAEDKEVTLTKVLSYEEHPNLLSFTVKVNEESMQDFIYSWILGNSVDYFLLTRYDSNGNEAFTTKHVVEDIVDWCISGSLEKDNGKSSELALVFSTNSTVVVKDRNGLAVEEGANE